MIPLAKLAAIGSVLLLFAACPADDPRPEGIPPEEDSPRSTLALVPEDTDEGSVLFERYCMACHQADGGGAGTIPALSPSGFVTAEDPAFLMTTVLEGRAGMPTFAFLSDEEIAAILTYLRQLGENDAGAITPETVGEHRD